MHDNQPSSRRPVAPFNPNPRWPAGYFQVLQDLGIDQRRHAFYAHWVRQFFHLYQGNRRRRDLGGADIGAFLWHLTDDPNIADWQVQQAREALEIYYEQFRGLALAPAPSDEETEGPGHQAPSAHGQRSNPPPRNAPPGRDGLQPSPPGEAQAANRIPPPRVVEQPASIPRPARRQGLQVDMQALEQAVRAALRTEHYARKTEKAYWHWMRQFVLYHHGRRPSEMGGPAIHQFLSHLAINKRVAASTQNQALSALVFLYRKVVKKEPGNFGDFPRARRPKRLPIVLSRQEVQALLARLDGPEGLIARLMYGTGMRVSEALRLRVQDLHFARNDILVRAGKGDKDRRVPFPASLKDELRQHLEGRRHQYEHDRQQGLHAVELPHALLMGVAVCLRRRRRLGGPAHRRAASASPA